MTPPPTVVQSKVERQKMPLRLGTYGGARAFVQVLPPSEVEKITP
jgi:hypothetical protein